MYVSSSIDTEIGNGEIYSTTLPLQISTPVLDKKLQSKCSKILALPTVIISKRYINRHCGGSSALGKLLCLKACKHLTDVGLLKFGLFLKTKSNQKVPTWIKLLPELLNVSEKKTFEFEQKLIKNYGMTLEDYTQTFSKSITDGESDVYLTAEAQLILSAESYQKLSIVCGDLSKIHSKRVQPSLPKQIENTRRIIESDIDSTLNALRMNESMHVPLQEVAVNCNISNDTNNVSYSHKQVKDITNRKHLLYDQQSINGMNGLIRPDKILVCDKTKRICAEVPKSIDSVTIGECLSTLIQCQMPDKSHHVEQSTNDKNYTESQTVKIITRKRRVKTTEEARKNKRAKKTKKNE
ncbi:unnamed protein product [Didymodactylos carnosus]|uniref:Uncharacterized protein n=1 Tax=Didymodactylos carnosus TaxID=1234261 RepID=A0A815XN60_9BILA|nr:unnamed protein product [Didymodactylos carnosus]CAF4421041.1 unnamed protein product [Didymodactylos carnosus]